MVVNTTSRVAEKIVPHMADAVPAIPLHTLPRIRPLATLLCKKKESFFGKRGGSEQRIGLCAWGETTYGDALNVD